MSRGSGRGFAEFDGAGSSWKRWTTLLVVLLASISLTAQLSGRPNRIMQALSAKPVVELSGTVHPLTAKATDMGAVSPDLALNSMTIHIAPSAAQRLEIAALQKELEDPKSPQYHKWLTQAQYGARFGLTDADLSQMKSWLTTQGFAVKSVSTSRNSIMFSGKATQAEAAFHTQLHQYKLDGASHFANATTLHVPAQFAGVVTTVSGLNTFRAKPNTKQMAVRPNYAVPNSTAPNYLSPADWATIYNVNTLYNQGFDGTGMHVGVVGQTYVPQADIDNFRLAAGLPTPTKLTYVCVNAPVCIASGDISTVGDVFQADLDIEWAGGIAKNATVDYIYTSFADQSVSVFNALAYAVETYTLDGTPTGPVVPVISISYTTCEAQDISNNQSVLATQMDALGAQAHLQGQTLVAASGDSGAAGCDASKPNATPISVASQGMSVNIPADSPNFTAVGGTMFGGDIAVPGAYWDTTTGFALGHIGETAWNETDMSGTNMTPLAASGGGESTLFQAPDGQPDLTGDGTRHRLVPDVAFAAASGHDGYLNCSSDSLYVTLSSTTCATGQYTTNSSGLFPAGGTSAATSSFAGMLTLFAQRYGPLGDVNPTLYAIGNDQTLYKEAFYDISVGDNFVPCGIGCNLLGSTAAPGYDMVTGLGSVNASGMLIALAGKYGSGELATTTALLVEPTSVIFGNTVTITATVTPASQTGAISGPVTFTASTPPIILGIAPVTVTAGVATATLPNLQATGVNSLTPGSNTITATYNGGPGYLPSASPSTTLTVTGSGATATTVSASPNSVALTGTTTLSATVTSAIPGALTGTVTFLVGSTAVGTANLVSGAATFNATVSAATGFSVGSDSISAIYSGDANYASSTSQSSAMTVTPPPPPSYTLKASTNGVTFLTVNSSETVTLTLSPTNYTGTVNFVVSVTSTNGTAANLVASAPSVPLTNGGLPKGCALTITANASAANHAPVVPWRSGGAVVFCLVLLGAPFGLRRKRALAVLLTALAISLAGFFIACGGSGGSSTPAPTPTPTPTLTARRYTVTVTPTGTGTVTDASPVVIIVTVP